MNIHCHLIVSRKDQSNKKKLSPLTNHKNTKKGAIKGGFDRTNLFQQAETGFDKLFGYQRNLQETFVYYNTMKNGSINDKLQMQEQELKVSNKPLVPEMELNEKQHHTQEKEKRKKFGLMIPFLFGKQRYIPRLKRQHQAASGFTRNLHTCASLWVVFPAKVLPILFFP